ncbi:hypothetical protein D4L85_16290 [Chryseolinea soli]|uniref:Uncharacterized protein n=1 Tax=Chryseolinea soli TaxID=2321403 RepID=A0A385SR44_9BACT|nr:hypothetical protein D4L85_16290 [Chryseolinea soli]
MARLKLLSSRLYEEKSLVLHRNINHFYYLQKIEEFEFLMVRLKEGERQWLDLKTILEFEYRIVFGQWKKDVRYLRTYLQNRSGGVSIL